MFLDSGVCLFVMPMTELWVSVLDLIVVALDSIMEDQLCRRVTVRGMLLVMIGCRISIMIIWDWMLGVLVRSVMTKAKDIISGIRACCILVNGGISVENCIRIEALD
jgi:hypothetical protein